MKAIEKEPERRYQTANALAHDVAALPRRRAGGGGAAEHRLPRAQVRRPAPGAVVAAAIVRSRWSAAWPARCGRRARRPGERDAARQEAARATALNDFMTQMLTASNPEAQGSRDVTVAGGARQGVGDARARRWPTSPRPRPKRALLLGETFRSLGKLDEAVAELERAVALREQGAASDPAAHSRSLRGLALAHRERGELDEALALYERASAAPGRATTRRRSTSGSPWSTSSLWC